MIPFKIKTIEKSRTGLLADPSLLSVTRSFKI